MALVNLFVGPTSYGLPAQCLVDQGLRVLPPVQRGDIETLVHQTTGRGVIVVCDGVFQSAPAVSHAELCLALDARWDVWGVASIGAIRAVEMRAEGMRGFGQVHAMLRRDADFADDEMCHLHFPEAPYFPVSEPLVNLRYALARQAPRLGISEKAVERTVAGLRAFWFGDRTLEQMRATMVGPARVAPSKADAVLEWLVQHRVKTMDLRRLLMRRPWRASGLAP